MKSSQRAALGILVIAASISVTSPYKVTLALVMLAAFAVLIHPVKGE